MVFVCGLLALGVDRASTRSSPTTPHVVGISVPHYFSSVSLVGVFDFAFELVLFFSPFFFTFISFFPFFYSLFLFRRLSSSFAVFEFWFCVNKVSILIPCALLHLFPDVASRPVGSESAYAQANRMLLIFLCGGMQRRLLIFYDEFYCFQFSL